MKPTHDLTAGVKLGGGAECSDCSFIYLFGPHGLRETPSSSDPASHDAAGPQPALTAVVATKGS